MYEKRKYQRSQKFSNRRVYVPTKHLELKESDYLFKVVPMLASAQASLIIHQANLYILHAKLMPLILIKRFSLVS